MVDASVAGAVFCVTGIICGCPAFIAVQFSMFCTMMCLCFVGDIDITTVSSPLNDINIIAHVGCFQCYMKQC